MASNQGWLQDGDQNSSDWIEVFNAGDQDVDLAGYGLTDDPQNLFRWVFPHINLPAGAYLVVFASGQNAVNHVDAAGYLHTNFQLDRQGEYLAPVAPNNVILSEFRAANGVYPEQHTNISYGIAQPLPNDETSPLVEGFQTTPTPGTQNVPADAVYSGFVDDPQFSLDHGFFQVAQQIEIIANTPGATIVYTTDGSTPTAEHGTKIPASDAQTPPVARVSIVTTTPLRAVAIKDDFLPSNVETRTYLFSNDVIARDNSPTGYPSGWKSNSQFLPADYEMDPEITQHPAYRDILDEALLSIPTLSIVTDIDNLFDNDTGIYMNPESDGADWERPSSVELIYPDGRDGFQADAGLRIQGGASRLPGLSPKHSFRLLFKRDYGSAKLEYPLFGPDAAAEFDTVILRQDSIKVGFTRMNFKGITEDEPNTFVISGQRKPNGRWEILRPIRIMLTCTSMDCIGGSTIQPNGPARPLPRRTTVVTKRITTSLIQANWSTETCRLGIKCLPSPNRTYQTTKHTQPWPRFWISMRLSTT